MSIITAGVYVTTKDHFDNIFGNHNWFVLSHTGNLSTFANFDNRLETHVL